MNRNDQLRSKTMQEINAWCYQRASHLSLTGHDQAAQALTEEHMESLQNAKPEDAMWAGDNRHRSFIAPAQCVISHFKESNYHKQRQNQKAKSCYKRH